MSVCRELMRRKLLEEIYDSMTPEDKRTFVQLTMENKDYREIMQALQAQRQQIAEVDRKVSRQTWLSDFSSNIAGNAVWDGFVWLVSRLIRKI